MLNSTISYLRTIAKGRNIDCYKNMSKKQLEDIKPQRSKKPIPFPRRLVSLPVY